MPKIYIFGFSASFNDSIIYFTEIQELDSAWIDDKTNFLLERNNYSYQLRDYLTEKGQPNRTCVTTYALERKDIEKKYIEMKNLYTKEPKGKKGKKKKNRNFDIRLLTLNDFKYEVITPVENENYQDEPKSKVKKQKKNKKKQAPTVEKKEEQK
ncbi:MAG: hypothetical protein IJ604_04325 [Prevotella sp.]|nr:hypothetical protein [Prevotella sp.]MBR1462590.1 hypothetical protein [Prevotella sp.]